MADRSEEGEQNGVNTWVNSQWNSFFTDLAKLLSEYVQKKIQIFLKVAINSIGSKSTETYFSFQ